MINKITKSIEIKAIAKNKLAMFSSNTSLFGCFLLIDAKDKIVEIVNNTAIIEVNSSKYVFTDSLEIRNDEITIRQKPSKFTDVFTICCNVLFAI